MPALPRSAATPRVASFMFVKPRLTSIATVAACLACGQGLSPERDAYVTAAEGQVSVDRDNTAWAVTTGEHVRASRIITTGPDGHARLEVAGGSSFEIFGNSRV